MSRISQTAALPAGQPRRPADAHATPPSSQSVTLGDFLAERFCPSCGRGIPRHFRHRYCDDECRDYDRRPGPRRFAYADPPYPGQSRMYAQHPDFAGEVDHRELVDFLVAEFPDGWALSTSARALQPVWALCPTETRLGLWLKEFVPMKPTVSVQHGWEAVLFRGGRPRAIEDGIVADFVVANPVAYKAVDGGVIGMKPEKFCRWLFAILGAGPGDELVDLFPGSGAVSKAWERFEREPQLRFSRGGPAFEQKALDVA
jgi:hypothetical protein